MKKKEFKLKVQDIEMLIIQYCDFSRKENFIKANELGKIIKEKQTFLKDNNKLFKFYFTIGSRDYSENVFKIEDEFFTFEYESLTKVLKTGNCYVEEIKINEINNDVNNYNDANIHSDVDNYNEIDIHKSIALIISFLLLVIISVIFIANYNIGYEYNLKYVDSKEVIRQFRTLDACLVQANGSVNYECVAIEE